MPAPPDVPPERPALVVHIDSPKPVALEAERQPGQWSLVCQSPCDAAVPASGSYRIRGEGVRPSASFGLPAEGKASLQVQPGVSSSKTGPIVVIVIGGLGLTPVIGVSAILAGAELLGAIFVCPFVSAFASKDKQNGAYIACLGDAGAPFTALYGEPWVWGTAIAGGVLLVTGIVWLATSHGHATLVDKVLAAAPPSAIPRREVAAPAPAIAWPQPVTTPLLTLHF